MDFLDRFITQFIQDRVKGGHLWEIVGKWFRPMGISKQQLAEQSPAICWSPNVQQ
jgi:hypothetical protein